MTKTQFEALVALTHMRSPAKLKALEDVLLNGVGQREAADKHGVSRANVNRAVYEIRQVIELCATAVTGVKAEMPMRAPGVGSRFTREA